VWLEEVVARPGDRLRLTFRGPRGPLIVHLKPAHEGEAFTRSAGVGIAVEADRVGERLGAWLRRLAGRLGERTPADLFALVEGDPDTRHENEPDSGVLPGVQEDGAGDGAHGTEGRSGEIPAWSRFFDDALDHETWEPYFADGSVVKVEHADMECFFSHPEPDPGKWAFYNDPRLGPPTGKTYERPPIPTTLVSEVKEPEVVFGSPDQHDSLVRAAAEAGPQCRFFVLNHLCTPVMLGEDLDGLASRLSSASGRPVLQLTRSHKDRRDFFGKLLELMGEQVRQPAAAVRPNTVNVLGFSRTFREEELCRWLRDLGCEVNAAVLPDVTASGLERLPRAGLNLVCEGGLTTRNVDAWLKSLPQPSVVVPAPYGRRGSRACMRGVAEAVQRPEAVEDLWQAHFEALREPWEVGRAAAAQLRLGVVVNARTWPLLNEPRRLSVPLVSLVLEMGFGLEVFVAKGGGLTCAEVERAAARLAGDGEGAGAGGGGLVCHSVQSLDELQQVLRARDCRAVYSDYGFDWRLSRAGLGQFSLRHFALGLRGALAAQRDLLAVAQLPFYRRYRRHLSPRGAS
jgi:Nitrogenase component 1 type Oxidoreductase